MTCRVVVIDDHAVMRDGLRSVLSRTGFEVVGEGGTGARALELVDSLAPDVLLLDARLPDMGGLEVLRRLGERDESPHVLVLSASSDPGLVSEALALGALGFVCKTCGAEELVSAVKSVARGLPHVGAKSAEAIEHTQAGARSLTPREVEIVQLIAEGLSSKEMAERLGISFRTVETHRERILRKLHLRNTAEVVRFAITAGISRT